MYAVSGARHLHAQGHTNAYAVDSTNDTFYGGPTATVNGWRRPVTMLLTVWRALWCGCLWGHTYHWVDGKRVCTICPWRASKPDKPRPLPEIDTF